MGFESAGSVIADRLFGWALDRGITAVVGSEAEREEREALERAATSTLTEVCDSDRAPVDQKAAKALGQHVASWLTKDDVAAMLFRAANTREQLDPDQVVERMPDEASDPSAPVPFSMRDFISSFVPHLTEVVGGKLRSRGMLDRALLDKLDRLIESVQILESAVGAVEDDPQQEPIPIGVRSFTRWAKDMDYEMDSLLPLEQYFEDRYIKSPELWHEAIYPELDRFFEENLSGDERYLLHLSAHVSIAFACGHLLDPKSGIDIAPVQRTSGRHEWPSGLSENIDRSSLPDSLWSVEPCLFSEGRSDLVVAVSVTTNVLDDVKEYVEKNIPEASRILHYEVRPSASGSSVQNGAHGWLLADELMAQVKQERTRKERSGTVHLLAAAPVGLMFFAGRLSRGIRRVALYEYDFEEAAPGAYMPSLLLPPPQPNSAAR